MVNSMTDDSREKFTGRAAVYASYRPRYPDAILEPLRTECALRPQSAVVDIASGTGLLAEIFLRNGNTVIGIEPNAEMRLAGENYLQRWPGFRSVDGSAEATTLAAGSVDFVTVGQALHWLDHAKARTEFARILKPGGWTVLVWNRRLTAGESFGAAYHSLVQRYGGGEEAVAPRRTTDEQIREFFTPRKVTQRDFPNSQRLDWEALKGRLLSSSYVPSAGQPGHEGVIGDLAGLFHEHQREGHIVLEYTTEVFYGQLHV
jgi:SAM-dependent methyltransferase